MRKALLFVLSLAVALALTSLAREPQFSDSQTYVLFLMFFAIGLWVTEAIPPFSVGLFILAFLAFSLGNPWFNSEPQDIAKYVNTFSSSVIWLMLGGFFLAAALSRTGLDADLLKFTLRVSGATPRRILIGLMSTTMVASMLMSNTATTAMVIAAVMPLLTRLGKQSPFVVAVLVGVPLAAAVGGMGTIIGTPPNILAAGVLEDAGLGVDFLHWMYFGVPLALFLTGVGCLALIKTFLKDNQPLPVESFETGRKDIALDGLRAKRRIVMVVLAVTLLLWMTSSLHHLGVAMVAAIPIVCLTMTSVLDASDIRALPWDTLLLVAGGLSLGLALQDTGLLSHYAQKVIAMKLGKLVVLGVFAFVTMLVSNIMSNTATSTILIPLGMATLPEHRMEIALIIGLSASTAMFLPVSTPPNAIAYSTGLVEQKHFRVGGILIGLLGPAAVIAWVLFLA
ncbi:MAG TPA: DASS family sodium-coupled anion symporter [Candidatus Krumholzibacteria bacterium]|nr:DASS family sodium-coupled anion symporter [Candidatus Krumholzibacteria bacterium]